MSETMPAARNLHAAIGGPKPTRRRRAALSDLALLTSGSGLGFAAGPLRIAVALPVVLHHLGDDEIEQAAALLRRVGDVTLLMIARLKVGERFGIEPQDAIERLVEIVEQAFDRVDLAGAGAKGGADVIAGEARDLGARARIDAREREREAGGEVGKLAQRHGDGIGAVEVGHHVSAVESSTILARAPGEGWSEQRTIHRTEFRPEADAA